MKNLPPLFALRALRDRLASVIVPVEDLDQELVDCLDSMARQDTQSAHKRDELLSRLGYECDEAIMSYEEMCLLCGALERLEAGHPLYGRMEETYANHQDIIGKHSFAY